MRSSVWVVLLAGIHSLRPRAAIWPLVLLLVSCRHAPVPSGYRTPLERTYGSQRIQILPDTHLNVVQLGAEHLRTLVFVHGDAGTFDSWRPQIEFFKHRYRIVAFERAECGRSQAPADSLTYSVSAEHITRLVEKLGIQSYVVIGHSRGQELAAFHFATSPKGLAALVSVGTGISVAPDPAARAEAILSVERDRRGERDLRADCFADLRPRFPAFAAALGTTGPEALELLRYACDRWRPEAGIMGGPDIDIRERLAAIDLPMLQIDGAAYRLDRDRRETMQRYFRRGHLVMMENVAHVPQLQAPAEFNRHLDQFLEEIGFR